MRPRAIGRFLLDRGIADATIEAEIPRLRFEKAKAMANCRPFLFLIIPCLAAGCVSTPTMISSKLHAPPQGIVLVVDGAGGYQVSPRAVIAAVEEAQLPLYVRSFDWTLGRNLGVADMTNVAHSRAQGHRLAEEITAYRTCYPGTPIYVMAHSAGSMVALESTQWLEADSVERFILFAPAVSTDYDLRQALTVSRLGIDAFTSKRDRLFLGLGARLVGTVHAVRSTVTTSVNSLRLSNNRAIGRSQ